MSPVSKKAAFTLIELLVVISIILIATSILFVGGGGSGDGLKLSSAQRIASSIAQGVRGQALLKNATTRLIIYSENNNGGDPDKFLRYFGIIYFQEDDPATTDKDEGGWMASSPGTYLPEGIYFDPDLSETKKPMPDGWTMNVEYPRKSPQAEGSGPEFYCYEFNSNGTTGNGFENSWLVLRAGTLKPGSEGELTVDFTEEDKVNLKAALIFRRVGSTTLVTDPSEI